MHKQVTLKRALATAALMPLTFGVITGVGMVVADRLQGSETGRQTMYPAVPGSPRALIQQHRCWSGEAPADMEGKVPGHVVVTKDERTLLGGPLLVRQALEQVFEGADHGLRVHAFCR